MTDLVTPRLRLRAWRDNDLPAFAALNADQKVMEYFAATLDRAASDASAERILAHFAQHGYGPWAVEIPGVAGFAGFTGLMQPSFEAHFTPCVEVGWRFAREYWGRGYATEAAQAALAFAFHHLGLDEIVSMTVTGNLRSRRVMEKLGMTISPNDDFDHPRVPEGHPLRRHVLYRLQRGQFER